MSVVFDLILPLGGATLAGLAIGAEREFRGQDAGLRTHALLCVGCALLMLMSGNGVAWVGPRVGVDLIIDPARVAQGVLAGLGFVCGGVIFRSGVSIHGLTTAASLWCVAVVGLTFGAERYAVGLIGTALLLGLLTLAKWVDARMLKTSVAKLSVRYRAGAAPTAEAFRATLHAAGVRCERISHRLEHGEITLSTTVRTANAATAERLGEVLSSDPQVVGLESDLRHG
ncbi:MAG: MgtC/SapB family protein [Caulobacterales bacterium]|nr:MgtC/SapB family protein [Caulobacterales bacterium]